MKTPVLIATLSIAIQTQSFFGQSDFVDRHASGVEIGLVHVPRTEGSLNSLLLSSSLNGFVDMGMHLGFTNGGVIFTPALGVHIGGERGQPGIAGFVAYTVIPQSPNYLTYGPSLYFRPNTSGIEVIPSVSFAFASTRDVPELFSFSLGIGVPLNSQLMLVTRPAFVLGNNEALFGFTIGLLFPG